MTFTTAKKNIITAEKELRKAHKKQNFT